MLRCNTGQRSSQWTGGSMKLVCSSGVWWLLDKTRHRYFRWRLRIINLFWYFLPDPGNNRGSWQWLHKKYSPAAAAARRKKEQKIKDNKLTHHINHRGLCNLPSVLVCQLPGCSAELDRGVSAPKICLLAKLKAKQTHKEVKSWIKKTHKRLHHEPNCSLLLPPCYCRRCWDVTLVSAALSEPEDQWNWFVAQASDDSWTKHAIDTFGDGWEY